MALNPKRSNEAANAAVAAFGALLNNGKLRIYTGTQPATADTAIGAVTLLAELTFGATAFGAPTAGVATANAIASDTNADNTGTAAWFRAWKSDGTSPVYDGTVGTASADAIINTVSINAGATVSCSGLTLTENK
jgi:hypothetical protein